MPIRKMFTVITLLGASAIGAAYQAKIEKVRKNSFSPADGRAMFGEYCATCHGTEDKGNGPAAGALKKTPADLTLLAAHNGGKFPKHISPATSAAMTQLLLTGRETCRSGATYSNRWTGIRR